MIPIDFAATTNTKFYPLYADTSRYLVLWGGGSSGKSRFAAQKLIARMLSEKGHRLLCLRKVAKTLRESVFAELKTVIGGWGVSALFSIPTGINRDLHIKCRANGNEILFSGLDAVEKRKSIVGITGIWVEEAS
ncbi:phage terminase large subunit, partial [Candidatus Hakubella thermalkaliphila]